MIDDVASIALGEASIRLSDAALKRVAACREFVSRIVSKRRVYGVNTGFGKLADKTVEAHRAAELQRNLVRSHSAGVGPHLSRELVRAAMVLRLNSLLKGYSGVTPELVKSLAGLLNEDIIPAVPVYGSLGASGDLAPLAHIALTLIGEGLCYEKGVIRSSAEVLGKHRLKPVTLQPKEGLALINGTQATTAAAILAYFEAERLVEAFDQVAALTIQVLGSSMQPFDSRIHALRPLEGQQESARRVLSTLQGSSLVDSSKRTQEPYSIRCIPQVHGSARLALKFAAGVLATEANSVSDNPIVFSSSGNNPVVSGGNFHAQPVSLVCDTLALALVPLGHLSEKRIEKTLDSRFTGLTDFLSAEPGLNTGFMIAQYTAASLAEECRLLATPASVDTASVSGGQEDHASMGFHASRKLLALVDKLWYIAAAEVLCSCQAADMKQVEEKLSPKSRVLHKLVRRRVPFATQDTPLSPLIEETRVVIVSHFGAHGFKCIQP